MGFHNGSAKFRSTLGLLRGAFNVSKQLVMRSNVKPAVHKPGSIIRLDCFQDGKIIMEKSRGLMNSFVLSPSLGQGRSSTGQMARLKRVSLIHHCLLLRLNFPLELCSIYQVEWKSILQNGEDLKIAGTIELGLDATARSFERASRQSIQWRARKS